MHALARLLNEQNWTVGQLMTSIQAYCLLVLDEMDLWEKDTDALATSDVDRFIPSQTLFDFLLCQLWQQMVSVCMFWCDLLYVSRAVS